MNQIDILKVIHEASQPHIQIASTSLSNHMNRMRVDAVTRTMVDSLLLALKDKNDLVTELYAEIDRLKAVVK